MPVAPERELDNVYSAIGEVLTDDEIKELAARATGWDIENEVAGINDPRKVKIQKTIEKLKPEGNERWLLTYVLIYVAAQERLLQRQEKLRERIVRAFPKTLIGLPQAESHVGRALDNLQKLMNTPLPLDLRSQLRPKQSGFAEIVQSVVTLFAYKSLHECWLKLLFTLSYNETLLANPGDHVAPNLDSIARQIDDVVSTAPAALALLGDAAQDQSGRVAELTLLSASLRAAAGAPDKVALIIDDIQRLVRLNLSQLNGKIFAAVQVLSFDPLMRDLPLNIEDRDEFKELKQAIRDLTATILARTLKHKMWQDAENQMSLVGSCLDLPDDATGIADDWFTLRSRVGWLAELEPHEQWSNEARKHTVEIETEIAKEGKVDDRLRMHFEAYRTWFKNPFKKMDEALTVDCGSLRKMDDPLIKILNELTR
jgi:hypothetical protein